MARNFEDSLRETIWEEVKSSGIIDDIIEDNSDDIKESVQNFVNEMDLTKEFNLDKEIEDATDKVQRAIDSVLEQKVSVESILNYLSKTEQFQKLIQEKVLEEFNKLWV